MKDYIEERAVAIANYIIDHNATVRQTAKKFGISKSTVHKDLSERLPAFNRPLYLQVKGVLEENKAERHIRGGNATRDKYREEARKRGGSCFACIAHAKQNRPPRREAGSADLKRGNSAQRNNPI